MNDESNPGESNPDESNPAEKPLTSEEGPIVAKVIGESKVDSASEAASNDEPSAPIREGSPFAKDPELWDGVVLAPRKPEKFYDLGPLRYTAMGAVAASVMVLAFALAASWWFPGGGTMIAALGCALAIFGLYSDHRRSAAACLILHLLLFILCYSRAITV